MEDLRLQGNPEYYIGSVIEVNYNRCKNKEHCNKNETEVD